MKKIISLFILVFVLFSCGENKEEEYIEVTEKEISIEEKEIKGEENKINVNTIKDFGGGLVLMGEDGKEKLYNNEVILFENNIPENPNVSWEKYNDSFFVIKKNNRVSVDKSIIYDVEDSKIYEILEGNINKIEKGLSGIFILTNSLNGDKIIFINNKNEQELIFENKLLEPIHGTSESVYNLYITDFELLTEKKIKIYYKENGIKKNIMKEIDDNINIDILELNIYDKKRIIIIGGESFEVDSEKVSKGLDGIYYYDGLYVTTLGNGLSGPCGLYNERKPEKISYKCDGPLIKDSPYNYCEINDGILSQYEFSSLEGGGGCGGYSERWQKIYIKNINGKDFIFVGNIGGKSTDSDKGDEKMKIDYEKYSKKEYLDETLKNKKNIDLINKYDKVVEVFGENK